METSAIASESAEFVFPRRKSILSRSISLRAFWTAVPASPLVEVLDDQLDWTAQDAAFGVDLVDRHLATKELVFPERRERAGQRIVKSDPDGLRGPRGADEWPGKSGAGER